MFFAFKTHPRSFVTPVAGTTASSDTLGRYLIGLIVVTVNAVVTNKWISKVKI